MNGISTQGQKACGGAGLATALCPGEAWHWVELLIQQLAFCSRSLLGTHRHALVPSLLEGPPAVLYKGGGAPL